MSVRDGTRRVSRKIKTIYERRRAAVYALCLNYAGRALNYFRQNQDSNAYWQRRTGQAQDRVFSDAQIEGQIISWFMAHGVDYGVYLELANDRAHEALRPTIVHFYDEFMKDLKSLYGGT